MEFRVKHLSRENFWHESDIRDFPNFMHKIKCQQAACDRDKHFKICWINSCISVSVRLLKIPGRVFSWPGQFLGIYRHNQQQVLKVIWEDRAAPRWIKRIANYWDRTALACWQWDLGHAYGRRATHRCRCCCNGRVAFVLLHFCTWISLQPPFRSWTCLYHKKGNRNNIQWYTVRMEILPIFHTRVDYRSVYQYIRMSPL